MVPTRSSRYSNSGNTICLTDFSSHHFSAIKRINASGVIDYNKFKYSLHSFPQAQLVSLLLQLANHSGNPLCLELLYNEKEWVSTILEDETTTILSDSARGKEVLKKMYLAAKSKKKNFCLSKLILKRQSDYSKLIHKRDELKKDLYFDREYVMHVC